MSLDVASRLCAGVTLIARGKFSLMIAGLAVNVSLELQLGRLAASYVLNSALLDTVLTRAAE